MKTLFHAIGCSLLLACTSSAQVAIDFNDQSTGQLFGQTGPAGTTGTWAGTTVTQVESGTLSSTYSLPQSGTDQRLTSIATTTTAVTLIDLSSPLAGTVYISYLGILGDSTSRLGIRLNPTTIGGVASSIGDGINILSVATSATVADVRVRSGGNNIAAANGSSNSVNITNPFETGFYVVKLDFDASGSNDRIQLWVNPDLSNGLLGTPLFDSGIVAGDLLGTELSSIGLGLYSTGANGSMDNLRIGSTLEQVVIPEPSSFALAAGGLAVFALLRRRRRV